MRARIGGFDSGRRIAQVEHHCRDWQGDVHRQRLAAYLGEGHGERSREPDVRAAHAAVVRELENPFGPGSTGR